MTNASILSILAHATPTPTSRSKGQKSKSRGGGILWRPPSRLRQFIGWPEAFCFCRAMLCKRGLCRHAVSVRPSVCPSITFVNSVKMSNHIFKMFSPSGSHTISVFPCQTSWRFSDEDHVTGASNAGGVRIIAILSQYLDPFLSASLYVSKRGAY